MRANTVRHPVWLIDARSSVMDGALVWMGVISTFGATQLPSFARSMIRRSKDRPWRGYGLLALLA